MVIFYVAGYCANQVKKQISCEHCVFLLVSESSLLRVDQPTTFLEILNRGGLKCPTNSVYMVCCAAYKVFCEIKICLSLIGLRF